MPIQLPPDVLAGMGLPPIPADDGSAAMPTPDYGGLHPDVARAIGLAPPIQQPELGDLPPPAPLATGLPSMAPPAGAPSPGDGVPLAPGPQRPDYQVPAPGTAPVPPAPPTKSAKPSGPGATPAPRAMTPEQGFADAEAKQVESERRKEAAVDRTTAASQVRNDQDLASAQEHVQKQEALDAQSRAISDERDKAVAAGRLQAQADNKAIDDYKLDQDKYWKETGIGTHIGWYIAMAMSGIGDALQGKSGPNPVIKMLQDRMHQSIETQVDARNQLKEKRGRHAEERAADMQGFESRQAEILRLSAQGDRALANKIDLHSRASANPLERARAETLKADLLGQSADKQEQYIKTRADYAIQKQQVGISQTNAAIAGGHLQVARAAEARAQKLQDMEYGPGGFKEQELGLKAAEEARKAMKDQQAKVKNEGLFNPTSAAPLLTANGKAMMAQADQLEAAARKDPTVAAGAYVQHLRSQATTPQGKAQVDKLEAQVRTDPAAARQVADGYVAQLRQNAKTSEVATISDPADRRKVIDGIKWGQDLINTSSKIRDFLTKDPDITDREGWGKLQAEYGAEMVEYAKSIGANASSRELDAISKHILTYDPNSYVDRAFRKAPGAAALEGLENVVKGGVDTLLKSHGVSDGWTPSSPLEQPALTFGGKTSQEIGEEAKPGLARQYLADPIAHVGSTAAGDETPEARAGRAEESALGRTAQIGKRTQTSEYGLDPKDEAQAHAAIAQADSVGNAERSRIIDSIAAPILAGKRPTLAAGLLNLVHDQDPKMYEEILTRLPDEDVKTIRALNAGRAGIGAGRGPVPSTQEALGTLSPAARQTRAE